MLLWDGKCTMKDVSEIYQRIAPELMKVVEERHLLLTHISYAQPIGRRLLSSMSELSERVVRSHVEQMKDNGLVDFTPQGMILTAEGKEILPALANSLQAMNKIGDMEQAICEALNLTHVFIAPGDYRNDTVRKELAFKAAKVLMDKLKADEVLAVSGGSTMASVADLLPVKKFHPIIIPARGGIGEKVEYQANVIASVIAEKTDGIYKMLHLPDGLSQDSLQILINMEPQIREIIELGKRAKVLMFGIGEALYMAKQRHINDLMREELKEKEAVGEALGHYFSVTGEVVYTTNNVGISLKDVATIPHVIAVAGGRQKAKAIIGVMRACQKGTLILDEGAAEEIIKLLSIDRNR